MYPTLLTQKRSGLLCLVNLLIALHSFATSSPEVNTKIFSLTHGLPSTDIPFRLISNMIIVPVTVGGVQELNFLVDTGTSTPIILHKRYVKMLDLPQGRRVNFKGAGSEDTVQGTVIPSTSLQIGDAFAQHIGAVVLDNSSLAHLKIEGVPIHGIIGASLFYSFAVEIDYLSQIIRLHEGQDFLQGNQFSTFPMQVSLSRPTLQTSAVWKNSTHILNLMIDTGFNNQLLIYDNSSINQSTLKPQKIGLGYSGEIKGSVGKVKLLHLGDRKFFNVQTFFPLFSDYQAKAQGDGIIGNALLKYFCVVLDYAHHTFYIKEHLQWEPTQTAQTTDKKATGVNTEIF